MIRTIVCKNYEEMSEKAAELVVAQLTLKPDSVLGLPTGSTPVGMYELLVDKCKSGDVDFSQVTTFNLDEYYPIKRTDPNSYYSFMYENLFSRININVNNVHILNGETDNTERECEEYQETIRKSGGIDLQILGIGRNGHIGFNEPGDNLNSNTHLTELKEDTIKANSRFFEKSEDVPKYALTMGITDILNAKKILILANGKEKHEAVAELMDENISTSSPATMLKTHSDVILICDEEAYGCNK